MKNSELNQALGCAVAAARETGALLRKNLNLPKKVNKAFHHDIKLELDVRSQKLIEKRLRAAYPGISILGEEGTTGDLQEADRWVIDPIDGTVNFTYGIPHSCISIALQRRKELVKPAPKTMKGRLPTGDYETMLGVVYDPFCDELWTAVRGGPARLNGKPARASQRKRLDEAIVSVGFAKLEQTLNKMLPTLGRLIPAVRKVRIMGAAALDICYVASGRYDAYLEWGVRLWDIAAGGLILNCAGGEFWFEEMPGEFTYHVAANNGPIRKPLEKVIGQSH